MSSKAEDWLERGSELLKPLLVRIGFAYKTLDSGIAAVANLPAASLGKGIGGWNIISATAWVWSHTTLIPCRFPTSNTCAQCWEDPMRATIQAFQVNQ
jgi:hypothetical protein